MVAPDRLLAFAAVAFAIIVIPGPSVLFIVGRGVALGRRTAIATAVGNELGELLLVIAVAFGLGSLVERSASTFLVLKLVGAAYLLYLGVQALRQRTALSTAFAGMANALPLRRAVRDGFVVGATNPKSAVLFAAILPQFVDRSRGHVPVQLFAFGCLAVVIALVSDTVWALLAGSARAWFGRSPRRLRLMGGTGGLVMIGLGLRLAFTGRHD